MFGSFPFKLFITKNIKFMKNKIFLACATLVVSVAAVVGVKAYNYYSMPELMRANLEALSQNENARTPYFSISTECLRCNQGTMTACMWDYEGISSCKPTKCSNSECNNYGEFMQ